MLGRSHPKVAAMLDDARPDLLAFAGFPQRHWRQIWSTKRSNDAPTSPECSLTQPRCCASPAPSWSSSTTNGKPVTDATSYESSMLELKTMNNPTPTVEEVTTLPELIAA